MTGERLTYRFGPLERRGILGQIRGGQAAAMAKPIPAADLLREMWEGARQILGG